MLVVMIEYNNTGSLVYMTHIIGHFTDSFARQQAVQRSPLFHFSMSHSPCILFHCTAVNINFLHSVCEEDPGKFYIQCDAGHVRL
jgi:hypothetical protein